MPPVAAEYALPPDYAARGIRRYGFHGLSYSALVRNLPEITGAPLPARVLACHLGNGASLCAIRNGQSADTTMGYSPLEGLTMGTRSGNIDANAVLRLVEEDGLEATRRLLNHDAGLLGLSGLSADMRALTDDGGARSAFAVAHFCYAVARQGAGMAAAMGGCDAIVFTGGIGENAGAVRTANSRPLALARCRDRPRPQRRQRPPSPCGRVANRSLGGRPPTKSARSRGMRWGSFARAEAERRARPSVGDGASRPIGTLAAPNILATSSRYGSTGIHLRRLLHAFRRSARVARGHDRLVARGRRRRKARWPSRATSTMSGR